MLNNRVKFFDGVLASSLIRQSKGNDEAAKQLLLIAAEYIRNREPLPYGLDEYLADAMETAVNNPARHDPYNADTGAALLVGLNLKRQNRPTVNVDPFEVCGFIEGETITWTDAPKNILISGTDENGNEVEIDVSPVSQAEAAKRAAKYFGISESTAKRIFKSHFAEYDDYRTAPPPDEDEMNWLAEMEDKK